MMEGSTVESEAVEDGVEEEEEEEEDGSLLEEDCAAADLEDFDASRADLANAR
jgi:hypothetical protein